MRQQSLEMAFKTAKKYEKEMSMTFLLRDGNELKSEYCARNDTREFILIRTKGEKYYYVDFNDISYVKLEQRNKSQTIGFQAIKNEGEAS